MPTTRLVRSRLSSRARTHAHASSNKHTPASVAVPNLAAAAAVPTNTQNAPLGSPAIVAAGSAAAAAVVTSAEDAARMADVMRWEEEAEEEEWMGDMAAQDEEMENELEAAMGRNDERARPGVRAAASNARMSNCVSKLTMALTASSSPHESEVTTSQRALISDAALLLCGRALNACRSLNACISATRRDARAM